MDTVGGYRLVRKLGGGSRAEVYLGHAGERADAAGLAVDPPRAAALKLYRSTTAQEDIDDEIEALARLSSRHLLELRDLATTPDGRPCLIFPRLSSSSLARLLSMRGGLSPGEVVTALAPIASAVAELHRVGVVHGAIEPSSVLFSDDGAPVLACFGRAAIVGELPMENSPSLTPAQLADEPRILADLDRLRALTRTVLSSVLEADRTPRGRELTDWLDSADPQSLADRYPSELAERLFDLAAGEPLRFEEREVRISPSLPGRVTSGIAADVPDPPPGGPFSRFRDRARVFLRADVDDRLATQIDSHPIAEFRARIGAGLGRVRRRFWIIGGLGAMAVIGTLAVIPLDATATEQEHAAADTASATAEGRPSGALSPSGTTRSTSAAKSTGAPGPTDSASSALRGDDPVAATEVLLERRARCFRTLSVLCLDGVDQKDASALDQDRLLVRSLQEGKGTAPPVGKLTATLSQRLGDSVLLTLQAPSEETDRPPDPAPATAELPKAVLIAKTQNGWLIRDLMVG